MNSSNDLLHDGKNIKTTKCPNIKKKKRASKKLASRKSSCITSKKRNVNRKKKNRKAGGKNVFIFVNFCISYNILYCL